MVQSTLTILEKAIQHNDIKTFRSALQTNGLPGDYLDYDLLIKSLRLGRKRIVNILLDNGCRVTKPYSISNSSGTTPLHVAVTKVGWSNVVFKLLARGARVTICNNNKNTPIHAAFINVAPGSVIDLLLKCYTRETLVNATNKNGLGLLHIACTRPHLDVVREFVDIGGSNILSQVSLQTNSIHAGYTPLHFAVENGRHKIVKFLCRYEADVGVSNRKGSTPLHLAVNRRDVKMIDILLQYADWNVNLVDSSGISHFMVACAGSDPEVVKQYLRIATDTFPNSLIAMISSRVKEVDNCPFSGYTPMHFAAEFGRLETVQLLLDRQAHCIMANQKLFPLDLARKRGHEALSVLLEQHCNTCKICENVIPEKITDKIFTDVNCNRKEQKSTVCYFNSAPTKNQVTSLDECCFLDIFRFPERKDHTDRNNDCDLCELQEIFLIDNCMDQCRDHDFNTNKTESVKTSKSVICNFHRHFQFYQYFSNGQCFMLFVTLLACVYIIVCMVFITKQ